MTDINALFYLVDIYIAKDKLKEALTILAKNLLKYPLMVPLLFKQAVCLFKFKYFEFAAKVAKVCCDLSPNSFEGWLLYSNCMFELQDYHSALISAELAPYNNADIAKVSLPEPFQYEISLPPRLDSSDCFLHFNFPTETEIDYSVINTPSRDISVTDLHLRGT